MTSEPTAPVPLTILTGFLGAGKTTLLNRLLTGDHGRRIAVLVNDFGSVNIDAELVTGVDDNMMSLANGCVCCEIRDDLLAAVEQLFEADVAPEQIVLEASGVADPAGIWATFAESPTADAKGRDRVRLDGVICLVDTDQIFTRLDEAPDLLMLKMRQIGFADLVVLNKVDLAGPETVAWVRRWIDETMDRVRVVEAVRGDVPLAVLLGVARPDGDAGSAEVVDHAHHERRFSTWTYETDRVFDEDALRTMIRKDLPGSVYRCKGFVWLAGGDGRPAVLQAVGRRSELDPFDGDVGNEARSRVVAISTGDIDEAELRSLFDACLV